jgi:hypothetical protein
MDDMDRGDFKNGQLASGAAQPLATALNRTKLK